eukprot:3192476-Prorocentrum_lima.AAC.1
MFTFRYIKKVHSEEHSQHPQEVGDQDQGPYLLPQEIQLRIKEMAAEHEPDIVHPFIVEGIRSK